LRQIVLDTETTGLDPASGHRIIEIGAVELVDRKLTGNHYHQYIRPDREIDQAALEVHGITPEFLSDKPRFADIADAFLEFVQDAELIIHNAPFDIGFLDAELGRLKPVPGYMTDFTSVLDTLAIARDRHPGQRNNLDALCRRYYVDNTQRTLHGALLDAEILADVYLLMTGGQTALFGAGADDGATGDIVKPHARLDTSRLNLVVIKADEGEVQEHEVKLDELDSSCEEGSLWRRL